MCRVLTVLAGPQGFLLHLECSFLYWVKRKYIRRYTQDTQELVVGFNGTSSLQCELNIWAVPSNAAVSFQGQQAPPAGGVTFYNPAQFAQVRRPQESDNEKHIGYKEWGGVTHVIKCNLYRLSLLVFFLWKSFISLSSLLQPSAQSGGPRGQGRFGGQRQYPVVK